MDVGDVEDCFHFLRTFFWVLVNSFDGEEGGEDVALRFGATLRSRRRSTLSALYFLRDASRRPVRGFPALVACSPVLCVLLKSSMV